MNTPVPGRLARGAARPGTLWLLVAATVAAGGACLLWAALQLPAPGSLVSLLLVAGLFTVASSCTVAIWTRTQQGATLTSAAVLVAVVLLPGTWTVVCAAAGVLVGKALIRRGTAKTLFNTAKDTIATAAALAAAQVIGYVPGSGAAWSWSSWGAVMAGMLAAAAAYATVDELLLWPVVRAATGTPWWQVAARAARTRTLGRLANIAIAATVVAGVNVDDRLFAVAPFAIVAIYLVHSRRLRVDEERQTWRSLIAAADTLAQAPTGGQLGRVLHTTAAQITSLFPGVEVEVEAGGRLVRADAGGIRFDGTIQHAPPAAPGARVQAPLASELDDGPSAGWVRLRPRTAQQWSAREQEQLQSLAAAAATAVRACQAYAAAADNAHHAAHDPLTGLANRRRLHEHAVAVLSQRARRYAALLLLDLDSFTQINDTLGHPAGDQLLIEAAARLRTAAGDDLVARIGGDEFAVFLSNLATPTLAVYRARQILASLRDPATVNGVRVDITASAGVAVAGDHSSLTQLLDHADIAMYQVKTSRDRPTRLGVYSGTRDRHHPTPIPSAPARTATEQLYITYQPIVALATGRAVAVQAQARWRHPELGDLCPADSRALAQRSGLLPTLTGVLFDQALQAATSWHHAGLPLTLAVNVPPLTLADPQFATTLLGKLERSGLLPTSLALELDPTTAPGRVDATGRNLATLRRAGVQIALDNVTSDHARLPALTAMPVDQLKVDCSTVGGLNHQPAALAVLSAIVALSTRIGATVVAYGLTQDSQRSFLWEHGCTRAQGHMFTAPVDAAELLRLLESGYAGTPGVLAPPVPAARADDQLSRGHRIRGLRLGLSH